LSPTLELLSCNTADEFVAFPSIERTELLSLTLNSCRNIAGEFVSFPTTDPLTTSLDAMAKGDGNCHAQYDVVRDGCKGVDSNDAFHIGGSNVGGVTDVESLLASLNNNQQVFAKETETSYVQLSTSELQTLSLQTPDLFGSSGLFLQSMWNQGQSKSQAYKTSRYVSTTNLAISVLSVETSGYTLWITDIETNAPATNCRCTLYTVAAYNAEPSKVTKASLPVTTNKDGVAAVVLTRPPLNQYSVKIYAVVEDLDTGMLAVVNNLGTVRTPTTGLTVSIITDRSVYKLGDTVHLKLYVRGQEGRELVVPNTKYDLMVRWAGEDSVVPVDIDPATGAFSIDLEVPVDADYGNKQLNLIERGQRWGSLGSSSLTVADPRPPTVLLALKPANDELVVGKLDSVDIQVSTNTYAGTAVSNQPITVNWQHTGNAELAGSFDVVSGTDGTGRGAFSLPDTAVDLVTAGDVIEFSATWVGPTREVVTADTSIIISNSPWSLAFSASPDQPLPGFEFASTVTVNELGSNSVQSKINVAVTLYATEGADTISSVNEEIAVGGAIGTSCTMVSGPELGCPIALPSIGKFLLVACVTDPNGGKLCSTHSMGRTTEEWAKNPLTSLADMSMVPDKQRYELGETAKFNFYNPFQNAKALFIWGNRLEQRQVLSETLTQGPNTLDVPVGNECEGGCAVTIVVSSPIQTAALMALPVNLATSSLFDATLPQRFITQHTLSVTGDSRRLEVTVSVDAAELTPGSPAGFTVKVTDADGAPVAGEVALFVVDKAFLDLKPHPAEDLVAKFALDLTPGYRSGTSNTDSMIGGSTYELSKARLASLSKKEPWLRVYNGQWPVRAGQSQAFDLDADEYLSQTSSIFITDQAPQQYFGRGGYGGGYGGYVRTSFGGGGGGGDMMASAGAPAMAEDASYDMMDDDGVAPAPPPPPPGAPPPSASASGGGAAIPIRSKFETAPLFNPTLNIPESGETHVDWKLPDNVGTFSIRAYAVSSGNKFGVSADEEQIARQPVSLIPSVPRISRVGDEFSCGVTVTAADPNFSESVTLSVSIEAGGIVAASETTKTVAVDGSGPQEITFDFAAESLEPASLVFSLRAGDNSDALSADIPVMSAQQSVFVATSMGVTASDSPLPWVEGLALPNAVPGSGSLDLLVGVGYLPAVRTIAEAVTSPIPCTDMDRCSAHDLINSMIAFPCLKQYGLADSDASVATVKSVYASSLALLPELTDTIGLRYSPRKSTRPYIDVYLNAWALYVMREVQDRVNLPSHTTAAAPLIAQWTTALMNGLVASINDANRYGYTFRSWDSVARARLALGVELFALPANAPEDAQQLLSMNALVEQAKSAESGRCGTNCKATTALILLREDGTDADATALLAAFADGLRVTGRTAYLAGAGSAYALDMATQTTVLHASLLCAASPIPGLLLQKLANYVAQGGSNRYGSGARGSDGVMRAIAMSKYDTVFGSNEPSIDFKATAGATSLLAGKFTPASLGPLASSTPWEDLSKPAPPLLLWATGIGQLNVAAGLTFVPADMPASPVYRGFFVEQIIQLLVNGEPSGPPLRAVPLGSMVSVTVQVTSPDDVDSALSIESWVPSGLEPMDPNVQESSGSSSNGGCGDIGGYGGYRYGWWWRCPSFERQTMADRVTYYAARGIRAGTQTLSYEAMAATVGTFALPPAQALIVMQPEVMGLSAGGKFEVSAAPLTPEQMTLPIASPPTDCPGDGCSGNGVCDIVTGSCQCNEGATGEDCSSIAPTLTMDLLSIPSSDGVGHVISLVGPAPDVADWLGAVSDNEDVVPSSLITIDRTTKTLKWVAAASAAPGATAVITVVVTTGTSVISRQFTALVGDGIDTSSGGQSVPIDYVERNETTGGEPWRKETDASNLGRAATSDSGLGAGAIAGVVIGVVVLVAVVAAVVLMRKSLNSDAARIITNDRQLENAAYETPKGQERGRVLTLSGAGGGAD
jgi:hypothetical protein